MNKKLIGSVLVFSLFRCVAGRRCRLGAGAELQRMSVKMPKNPTARRGYRSTPIKSLNS